MTTSTLVSPPLAEHLEIIRRPFHRSRTAVVSYSATAPAAREPSRRPAAVAHQLALAHHLQRAIDAGTVAGRSAAAGALGILPARMTQVLDLLILAPDIQEEVLFLEAVDGLEPLTERDLRGLTRLRFWSHQRALWAEISEKL